MIRGRKWKKRESARRRIWIHPAPDSSVLAFMVFAGAPAAVSAGDSSTVLCAEAVSLGCRAASGYRADRRAARSMMQERIRRATGSTHALLAAQPSGPSTPRVIDARRLEAERLRTNRSGIYRRPLPRGVSDLPRHLKNARLGSGALRRRGFAADSSPEGFRINKAYTLLPSECVITKGTLMKLANSHVS